MKYFAAIILTLFFCLENFAGETAPNPAQIVLTVEVTNGTAGGSSAADDAVVVRIFKGQQLLSTLNGKVGRDNKAVFNIPTEGDTFVVAGVMHQNTMFNGQPIMLEQTQNPVNASIEVFDVSNDKSKLSVQTHHLIIKARSNVLEITEYMQLKNSSDMAVSSEQKDNQSKPIVLEIMLPRGFKNLECSSYFEQDALVITEKGFYDTMAVAPGEYEVTFSYTLDISSNTMNIVKKLSLPTSEFAIFTELGRAKLQGLEMDKQLVTAGGIPMEYYKRSNLPAGEKITFQITGFNAADTRLPSWLIIAATVGAVAGLAIVRLLLKKSGS